MLKKILITSALLLVGSVLGYTLTHQFNLPWLTALFQQQSAKERKSKAQQVLFAPVKREVFIDKIEALGTTRANEYVEITSNVREIVEEIYFDDGAEVEKSALLVELNNDEELSQLHSARVNLDIQKREFERLSRLANSGNVPDSEVDTQKNRVKKAEAELQAALAREKERHIKAPFAGKLGFRQVSLGTLVEPGDVIVTLDDLSVIKLDFSVPETFLGSLHPGMTIVAKSPAYPKRTFEGQVKTVDSRVVPYRPDHQYLQPNRDDYASWASHQKWHFDCGVCQPVA